jgi:hypothetical protein
MYGHSVWRLILEPILIVDEVLTVRRFKFQRKKALGGERVKDGGDKDGKWFCM